MVRLLRIALTWLLALALPVQGYAASTMLSCGQAHHHEVVVAPMHKHAATAAHDHIALADDPDGHQQSAASGIAQDDSAAELQAVKAVGTKCSMCAACCSVTAIATSVPLFDVVPVAPDFGVTSFEHRAGVTTGGLERPPRIVLA